MRAETWQAITKCSDEAAEALAKGWKNENVKTSATVKEIDAAMFRRSVFMIEMAAKTGRRTWEERIAHGKHLAPKLYAKHLADDEIPWLVLGYPNNNLYGIPRRNHRTGRAQ